MEVEGGAGDGGGGGGAADGGGDSEGPLIAGRQVWVRVEAALQDVLVVSCGADGRHFQGVLLDCSKRNLPFGVSSLHPVFSSQKSVMDNKLYSVSQRFAYQDPDYNPGVPVKTKQQQQRPKMTVRLRPRKVLCSNCKGICNENSENVVQTRKRKSVDGNVSAKDKKSDAVGRNKTEDRTLIMGHSLIPKLSRLHPNEITNALNGNSYGRNEIWIRQTEDESENNLDTDKKLKNMDGSGDSNGECPDRFIKSDAVYSSSEKSCDNKYVDDREFDSESERQKEGLQSKCESETSVNKKKRIENSSNNTDESSSSVFSSARTLKISFGEGEGTVLKLPAIIGDFNSCEEDPNASFVKTDNKAARRAIKKAKKQARRQATPETHPSSPLNDTSYQIFQRKHKHKVKHKKKKKDEKKIKPVSDDLSESQDENQSSIEEPGMNNAPTINNTEEANGEHLETTDAIVDVKMCEDTASDWVNCEGSYSGIVPGDVVWGKLQGFPWWPGRVVSMGSEGQARVAWFASSTSSLVPCQRLAPFLDNFKVHFNKKKRGPYKEAVRLATLEAGGPLDPLATDPLAPAPSNTLAPLSSPPID
ncbi:uncharacterized protein LOC143912188 isoform X2 [Arctopsyche grandis]